MMDRRKNKLNAFAQSLKSLDGVEFAVEIYSDGRWVAESKNVDGMITGGTNVAEMDDMLKDAIFTYFGVSPTDTKNHLLQRSTITYTERIELSPEYQPA